MVSNVSRAIQIGVATATVFTRGINAATNYNLWACDDCNAPFGVIGAQCWTSIYSQSVSTTAPPQGPASCSWHKASSGMLFGLPPGSWTVSNGPANEWLFYAQSNIEDGDKTAAGNAIGDLTIYDTGGMFRSKQVKCKKVDGGGSSEAVWNNIWDDKECANCMWWQTRTKPRNCYTSSICRKLVECQYDPWDGVAAPLPPKGNKASSLVGSNKQLNIPSSTGIESYCKLGALLPQNKEAFEKYYQRDKIQAFFGDNHRNGYDQVQAGMLAVASQTADYSKNHLPKLKALPQSIQTFAKNTVANYQKILAFIKPLEDDADVPEETADKVLPILQQMQKEAVALNKNSSDIFKALRKFQTDTQVSAGGVKKAIDILSDPNNNGQRKAKVRRQNGFMQFMHESWVKSMRAALTNIGRFCGMVAAGMSSGSQSMDLVNDILSSMIANLEGLERAMDYSKDAVRVAKSALTEQLTIAEKEWQTVASAQGTL